MKITQLNIIWFKQLHTYRGLLLKQKTPEIQRFFVQIREFYSIKSYLNCSGV
jgi:hypothetical protein